MSNSQEFLNNTNLPDTVIHIVSENPIIIMGLSGSNNVQRYIDHIGAISKLKKVYLILSFWWTLYETEYDHPAWVKKEYWDIKNKYPNIEITYLTNSIDEYALAKKIEIPTIYCNQNAFLDEKVFKIIPEKIKNYDAIYNASFAPYKRHYLADGVKSLALIGYEQEGEGKTGYLKSIIETLPNAVYLNFNSNNKFLWFGQDEVCDFYNQSRVGLCLSEKEGAMYASAEYLLCGLPVVSTHSLGGRDTLFDDMYVKIVENDPEKVSDAVEQLISSNISPTFIREKTLEKMSWHRTQFNDLIKSIFLKEGILTVGVNGWYGKYTHKMLQFFHESEAVYMFKRLEIFSSLPFEVLPWNGCKAAISLTFGGGDQNHYLDFVALELSKRSISGTFNVVVSDLERIEDWKKIITYGHQIGNSSLNHLHANELTAEDEIKQVKQAKIMIEEILGVVPLTFCYPYNEISPGLKLSVEAENILAEGTWGSTYYFNPMMDVDWFNIPTQSSRTNILFETYKNWIDQNLSNGSWTVLSINSVEGCSWGWEKMPKNIFIKILEYISGGEKDLWVAPFGDIGSYWKAQKILENSKFEIIGSKIFITWEKPKIFLNGIFLKVRLKDQYLKVSQSGQLINPIEKNTYSVSFDIGNLMIEKNLKF